MSKLKRGERVESDRRARPLDRMAKFDGQRIRSTPFTLIAANLEKTAGLCGSCRAIEFPRTFNRHAPQGLSPMQVWRSRSSTVCENSPQPARLFSTSAAPNGTQTGPQVELSRVEHRAD